MITRQERFLAEFPDAQIDDGALLVFPCWIDTHVKDGSFCKKQADCDECRKKYWLLNESTTD